MAWFRKLTEKLEFKPTLLEPTDTSLSNALKSSEANTRLSQLTAAYAWQPEPRPLPIHQLHLTQAGLTHPKVTETHYTKKRIQKEPSQVVSQDPDNDPELKANMSALANLRGQPRGAHIDSRIAAIQDLLGEREVFRTLHNLRWPHGVVCPRCRSTHVVRRDPPPEALDSRFFYECLTCKGSGNPSSFDDLTGLPVDHAVKALRQWILCWYLLAFCSMAQIAKILGLSVAEIAELASLGANLVEVPETSLQSYKQGEVRTREEKRKLVEEDELRSRSLSGAGRYKPGPKSRI